MEIETVHYLFSHYSWILVCASSAGAVMVVLTFRNWSVYSARYLVLLGIAVTEWSLASVFETAGTTIGLKILWSQIAYFGTVATPLLFFLFALAYSRNDRLLNLRFVAPFAVIPVLTLIFAWTNGLHGWIWPGIRINYANNIALYSHGFWFWINIVYSYFLVLFSVVMLMRSSLRQARDSGSRVGVIIIGALIPLLANFIYLFDLNPIPGMEWTPISFLLSTMILSIGVSKLRLFRVVPVARKKLVDRMDDGVLVVDDGGNVADMNSAMERITGARASRAVGVPVREVFADWPEVSSLFGAETEMHLDTSRGEKEKKKYYEIHASVFAFSGGREVKLFVFHDITERKKLEAEKEALIIKLQGALNEVNTLSGLLPICASCKRIRDDKGYWRSVEAYIRDHADVSFSHGICPECMEKLYPEVVRKRKKLET